MPTAVLRFRRRKGRRGSCVRLENAAESLLASLYKSGQIEREWLLDWKGDALSAWCSLPAADSLDDRYATPWVRDEFAAAMREFGVAPSAEILGDHRPVRAQGWRSAKALLLFTRAFDRSSPICRGDSRRAIPLYALPLDQSERERFRSWVHEYSDTDSVWLGCGPLERAAYRQLADPRSALLKQGRELAALVEDRTSRPTYLFVMRYYGRKGAEAKRRCPSCRGPWRRRDRRGPLSGWEFPFRCGPCRLVSAEASDFG